LEKLVIEVDPDKWFDSLVFPMLSPHEEDVPSPLLSTLELRNIHDVAKFTEVLKARSDAGSRLSTLRIKWFEGCEARMGSLAQCVDKLEFYHVTDGTSRGLELPDECMAMGRWWEPWSRGCVREMAGDGVPWTYDHEVC
jgi:hypothetical protein